MKNIIIKREVVYVESLFAWRTGERSLIDVLYTVSSVHARNGVCGPVVSSSQEKNILQYIYIYYIYTNNGVYKNIV